MSRIAHQNQDPAHRKEFSVTFVWSLRSASPKGCARSLSYCNYQEGSRPKLQV